MLTMSRSFPVSVAVSGKLPVHLCRCSQEWSSSRLRGLPDPSTILGLYLTTSQAVVKHHGAAWARQAPGVGAVSLGLWAGGGWIWEWLSFPFRIMVSHLRSNTSLSAAPSPLCPEQPY